MAIAKRALILGLDALVPNMTEKFLAEGILPNLAKLTERGCFTRLRPVIPAQTPTNWNTIATGATPGTHGVTQWGSHRPGEPVWQFHQQEAFNAGLCQAEYLWEAAARAGRRSVVFNYAGYPPTTGDAIFIEWLFRPSQSYFDLAAPTVYHNCPDLDTTDPISLTPARDWSNLPTSNQPPLQAELPIATVTEGTAPTHYALILAAGNDYDTVLICPTRNAHTALATLSVGQWSDWLRADFDTADQGPVDAAFRFKLLELSPHGRRLRLYRSDAFATDGRICSDRALGRKLIAQLGPYIHSGGTVGLHCHGILDFQTTDQVLAAEARWWSGAAELAMQANNASLLVLHWHILDEMGHCFVPKVDPTGTDYDPDNIDTNWNIIRNYYRAADRFVGAFLDRFDDGKTVFAVVADHGMPANIKAVSLINLFKEPGWVSLTADGQDVDWPASKLSFAQHHLWINLQGRNQGGIVPADQYLPLRSDIIRAMRDLKDPDTGRHVFAFVLPREDAPVVGLWGDYIGDVVFCYAGGYRWSGPEVLRMAQQATVFPCGGGNHGPMMPTYETDTTSVMATLILAGPGVKAGVKMPKSEQVRLCTTDLAPTLAHLLNMQPPAQSEGRILHELLHRFYSQRPPRQLKPTARTTIRRPTVKPKPIALQGDVTDEY